MGRCNKTIKTYLGRPLLIMDAPNNEFFTVEYQITRCKLSFNQICAYRTSLAREIGNCLEHIGITYQDRKFNSRNPIPYSKEVVFNRRLTKLRCKQLQRLLAYLDRVINFKSKPAVSGYEPPSFEDWYKEKNGGNA